MFRSGPGQESPQDTIRPPFPGPPRSTMPKPSHFGPPPSMHGRGGPPVPPLGHSQHNSSQYHGYPGSERGAGQPPPHPPGSATIDRMSQSPVKAAERRIVEEPPLAPQDQEMLKNIEILASFVVKNGPQFEDMARQKQANDPKFGFLFGGGPGSDAALGQDYYEWKKRCLTAAAILPADGLIKSHSNNESKADARSPLSGSPLSPDRSDMNMEDDFEEPSLPADTRTDQVQEPVSMQHAKREPGSSRTETNSRPQGAQNPRVPTPLSVLHQSNSATASRISPQVPQSAISSKPQSDTAHDELPRRKDTRRRTGFDRPCMEDVTPVSCSPLQTKPQELGISATVEVQRSRASSRVSRWGLQDPILLQDSSRRPSFSVDTENNNFHQDLDRSLVKDVDTSVLDDRLEAVTPQRDDDSGHETKGAKDSLLKETSSRLKDWESTENSIKPSRYQTKDSLFRSENKKMKVSDDRRARDSPPTFEELSTRDGSPRFSKQQRDVSEPDPGSKAPTVDEFGRFVRPGGSESDGEDPHADRKRRNGSGSKSRSPSDNRRRRRSRSRSLRRHSRRSHSRSRSPRRRRSRSNSPHGRDSRRGGDGARGWERGHQERNDRGGRKGGRGDRGGGPPQCLDFSRGRCKRGDGCRFSHSESAIESPNEGRYERAGGRGGRGSRQEDRQDSHDGGRSHGGSGSKSGWGEDVSRSRREWEPNDGREKIHKREPRKSFEEMAREQPETSPVSDYGDELGAKPSETRDKEANDKSQQELKSTNNVESAYFSAGTQPPHSGHPGSLPTLAQLPPPPPMLPRSQGFSSASIPPQQSYMDYLPSQSGFNLPPPPPPTHQNRHLSMSQQPSYGGSETQQSASAPPQLRGQSTAPSSRPGYTWQTTPTAAPASMAYTGPPVQATGSQSSYGLPPPPQTAYTNSLSQYQLPQQTQAGQSGEQFNMMADRIELRRPTAADPGGKGGQGNITVSSIDQWKGNAGNGTSRHMNDVILESVSPGLPGHHHMENMSPGPGPGLVMENVSPAALVAHASSALAVPQQAMGVSTLGSSKDDNPPGVGLESLSPAPDEPQNWSPGGGDETNKGDKRADKKNKREKEDNKIRGLTLLRTAVAEHVKETLKPTWREGQMSKEAFKTIAKKAVDKVLDAIKPHQVPKTDEKVAVYMENARPKITKLVQGYVDKYVKF